VDLGLDGARVLVTGASGGIGHELVRAFAAEGARVAVHYHRSAEAASALAEEVGGTAFGADLRDPDGADGLVSDAVAEFGGLDVCVANAGVWPREPVPVWDLEAERWNSTIAANLTATFLTCRAFLRHVAEHGHEDPALVLISSTAGRFGEAGHADYAAAKGAIATGLLLSLKNEVTRIAPRGRVNVVAPGWTVSPMTDRDLDPGKVEEVTATMPLRKVASPADVAAAVVWLASEGAGHVTGEVVTVAGGMEGRLLNAPSSRIDDPETGSTDQAHPDRR
jgi:3-oxoacyl-[acyl-carrier protein] reductase